MPWKQWTVESKGKNPTRYSSAGFSQQDLTSGSQEAYLGAGVGVAPKDGASAKQLRLCLTTQARTQIPWAQPVKVLLCKHEDIQNH